MSILSNIISKILGGKDVVDIRTPMPPSAPATTATPAPSATPASTPTPTVSAVPRLDEVDVVKLLDGLAAKNAQKLDWRKSIVDMMKLLGMESSLAERKELAKELGYTADTSDSAKMNVWLHSQVMQKLADNGGKVPAELLK